MGWGKRKILFSIKIQWKDYRKFSLNKNNLCIKNFNLVDFWFYWLFSFVLDSIVWFIHDWAHFSRVRHVWSLLGSPLAPCTYNHSNSYQPLLMLGFGLSHWDNIPHLLCSPIRRVTQSPKFWSDVITGISCKMVCSLNNPVIFTLLSLNFSEVLELISNCS